MDYLKKAFFLAIGVLLIGGSIIIFLSQPANPKEKEVSTPQNQIIPVLTASTTIMAEVADSPEARSRGLSGRAALPDGSGMLFIFEEADFLGFWMPDMRFSIDIIWIDDSKTVVGVENSVSPETYPEIFSSPVPVRYVLEVPAGFAAAYGISEGEKLVFEYKK